MVAFIQDHGATVADRMRQRLSAEVVVRPPFPYRRELHVSDYYLQTFAERVPQPDWPPAWQAPATSCAVAEQKLLSVKNAVRGCWVMHPGSGGVSKNWPLPAFRQQAEWLRQQGAAPVFLLGPAEVTMAEAVHALARELMTPVWDNFPLTDCAALLSRCDGFLGNDAGIAHLAAVLGLPTVAVFVNSDPVMWQPLGSNVSVVDVRKEKEVVPLPGSEAVQEALSRWVPLRSNP